MAYRISSGDFDIRRVCRVENDFSSHPALQFDALRKLALRLHDRDTGQVKFIEPNAELNSEFVPATESYDGRSIDDPVSVTIGFVFYTASTRKHANIYALNAILRRLGRTPKPPGENAVRDAVKYVLGYCASRLLALFGKVQMPRGL